MFHASARNVNSNPVTRAAAERVASVERQEQAERDAATRRARERQSQVLVQAIPAKRPQAVDKSIATLQERAPKLTCEQRSQIIGMLNAGRSAAEVARHFRIHRSTVGRVAAEVRLSSIADWS